MSSIIVGQTYDLLFKMVVIGDSAVGKTNLLSRYQRDEFSVQSKPTIGVQFATKTLSLDSHKIKIQIWDTAGQERFKAITQAYYKGTAGALIVFDLTRRSTFQNIGKWLKELKENAQQSIVSILIGNKCDLSDDRGVKLQQVQKFAEQNNLAYLQTSAKDNTNVLEAFHKVIQQIYQKQIKNKMVNARGQNEKGNKKPELIKTTENNNVKLNKPQSSQKQQKKKCC